MRPSVVNPCCGSGRGLRTEAGRWNRRRPSP